ncbi:MAG: decaprenyl-phosphate phosphoribosyltransferase [Reyranellales bacterium]
MGAPSISTSAYELVRLLRPRQWIKNTFVLAPLVFAHKYLDAGSIRNAVLAFALFCVAASAGYIVNDLRDVERDRRHPVKKTRRPLAAGKVSPQAALIVLGVLYCVLMAGWLWSPRAMMPITGYVLLNIAYSYWTKHQPVLDIFSIAAGFVLRVYAGAEALGVPLSSWMAITTLCLALYLAAIKRRQELGNTGTASREVLQKYSVALVDRYAEMSATGALIFYSLFVISSNPKLSVTIPLVLFGMYRYWYVVEARDGGESPTDAVFSDWPMAVVVVLWIGACVAALWP